MKLIKITDKEKLDGFTSQQENAQFLQSWEWGEFQEKTAGQIFRFGVEENEQIVATATLIKKPLLLGYNYFYCPRGPLTRIMNYESGIMNYLFDEIKKIAEKEKIIFLRFEPLSIIHDSKFMIQKTIDIQPSQTSLLNLTKSEEELLVGMHQKTRYNIRLAEKKSVKIIEADKSRFEDFWSLMKKTGTRDGFRLHEKNYYLKMLDLPNNFFKIFLAEFENKVITGMLVSFYGDTVTYLHGASADDHRNVMAPYLLQWHVIGLSKKLGYKFYDFHGIDETKWPGVTRFKNGFGGQTWQFPGTYDLIFNAMWYNVYQVLRKLRRSL
jgi:peptidoglycan pentaglycine glycine transferase (the first glycine)